jgi:hypothetical protein
MGEKETAQVSVDQQTQLPAHHWPTAHGRNLRHPGIHVQPLHRGPEPPPVPRGLWAVFSCLLPFALCCSSFLILPPLPSEAAFFHTATSRARSAASAVFFAWLGRGRKPASTAGEERPVILELGPHGGTFALAPAQLSSFAPGPGSKAHSELGPLLRVIFSQSLCSGFHQTPSPQHCGLWLGKGRFAYHFFVCVCVWCCGLNSGPTP